MSSRVMESYKYWRKINIFMWLYLAAYVAVLANTRLYDFALIRYFLVASLLMFFWVQFKVSFSKCSECSNYIINPAHFWFGSAILTNAKVCKQCR